MSTSGDVESPSSSNSVPGSAFGSPRTKVKFLCSYGGEILPRPTDAHLKYVGGETRIISVHRYITFTGLMRKLSSLMEGNVILKYQMIPEDLDALVTVKSDEDLRHMFEEYDRNKFMGPQRLRTFLFPANPIIIENQTGPMDRHSLEQRTPPGANIRAISTMTRARSSPNLCNLGGNSQTDHKNPSQKNQQHPYHHQHRQWQPQPQPHQMYPQPYHKPPQNPNSNKNYGPDHLIRVRSSGLADYSRHPMDHNPYTQNPYPRSSRGNMGGCLRGSSPYDEYYGNNRHDRESPPGSPLGPNPAQSNYMSKWDFLGAR